MTDVELTYEHVPANAHKWTFQDDTIRKWTESKLSGRVLNICAGKTELEHDGEVIRNDIDEDRSADMHVDAMEISDHVETFDTVVFDPPFSVYQANKTYNGDTTGYDTAIKQEIHKILRAGGSVIQFGYTTTCMPAAWGYDRDAVAVWNTTGRMNDILSVVDVKNQSTFGDVNE